MQIHVNNGTNIPKDAIFSIKSNTVRRQDRFSSGRPFKFPGGGTVEGHPLKIDIIIPFASAYVEILPRDGSFCTATFQHASGEESPAQEAMRCDLRIGSGETASGVELTKPALAVCASDAKSYLEKFKVLEFLQAALGAVIKTRPENPFAYMATLFTSGHINASTAADTDLGFVLEEIFMEEATPQANGSTLADDAQLTKVYVHNGINIPTEAILSIKSSTVRRQDHLSRGRPFKFPVGTAEGQPLKIDVMIPFATAYVVTTPSDDAVHRVTFVETSVTKAREPIQCDLRVTNKGLPDGRRKQAMMDSPQCGANDAKIYLEDLKVLEFVQAVLHAVIKTRPEDPLAYITTLCTYTDVNSRGEKATGANAAEKRVKKAEQSKQTKPRSDTAKNVTTSVEIPLASCQDVTAENQTDDTYESAVAQAAQLAEAAKEARETAEKAAKAAEAAAVAAARAAEMANALRTK